MGVDDSDVFAHCTLPAALHDVGSCTCLVSGTMANSKSLCECHKLATRTSTSGPATEYRDPLNFCWTTTMKRNEINFAPIAVAFSAIVFVVVSAHRISTYMYCIKFYDLQVCLMVSDRP